MSASADAQGGAPHEFKTAYEAMLTIDGNMGEGGGQILRTALALSTVLGKPFQIVNLRAKRRRPGLQPQHLVCVQAAAEISGARVAGAQLDSKRLEFLPGATRPGEYRFDIGTAGSTTLVLQTILPALMTATSATSLQLVGGTHNPQAPPYEFLAHSFVPLINRLGPRVQIALERPGYFPRGGGCLAVKIEPTASLAALRLFERGSPTLSRATATVAGLPIHIAERELRVVEETLGWSGESLQLKREPREFGPGNVLTIELGFEQVTEVVTGFGRKGVPAEIVAEEAVQAARRYLDSGVPVSEHLADQLLIPLALAGHGAFTTLTPSLHTRTNLAVIRQLLDRPITLAQRAEDVWQVEIAG